jgi:periplasmic divalent cation tolerance protein
VGVADSLLMMTSELRILLTTCSDRESSEVIVRQLLGESLIACGTILPGATSLYLWKEKVEEASEMVLLMKTDQERSNQCMRRLQDLHPYDVPEIILLEPKAVSAPYASWVREVLGKGEA